jgi:integrase
MAKIKLQYVKSYINRHGKVDHYFRRRRQPLVRLPGLPGSPEFMAAYNEALGSPVAQVSVEPGAARTKPGTIAALITRHIASGAFQIARGSTQAQYMRILNMLRDQFGDLAIGKLERAHIKLMLEAKAATPTVARTMLRILRLLIVDAIDSGFRKDDPSIGLKVKLPKSDGFPTWEDDEIARFEAAYAPGTKERMALALLLNFAARCSDVVQVGPGNVRGDELSYVQKKTGAKLTIPMLDETTAAIAAMGASAHLVFLVNDNGAAFTEESFSKWLRKRCRAIGLDRASPTGKKLSPHGLRKAACVRLAHAGCSTKEIAAISGHKALHEIERYTRDAEQARLARSAMARLREQKKNGA